MYESDRKSLHLNSLRVCNLSKLYGLFALVSILQGNRFNCERYLYSCRQFLNYIFEKEKTENNLATVHDYAKADDDMFLYTFSKALLAQHDGDNEEALKLYEQADIYLKRAEGNQIFLLCAVPKEQDGMLQECRKRDPL